MTSTPVKKPSAIKSLWLFTNKSDVKNKTATCRVGSAKSERKVIKSGTKKFELKQMRKVNSKINDQIKKSLYDWIMHHPQVVKSPIVNVCMKLKSYGHTEPQLVPNILLQVYIR